ncbi:MAG TPA: K(+)-transporting ATPase subunit C [Saprospiraceae bacterium]|nr:K(+)-transporting ATPase subunit C [Saprospiraceae bacterium]
MKQHILPALKLTLLCLIFFSGIYTMLIFGIAQFAPNHGKGELIQRGDKTYYSNIGQYFSQDNYFWSRPSVVNYNAAGAGGSNKGPSNPEYLAQVQTRIDSFLVHNPDIKKSEIPSDIVTASGSGLDPNISVQAALVQVKRISNIRNIKEDKLQNFISQNTEKPLLGLFGPGKINVLKLNIALTNIK